MVDTILIVRRMQEEYQKKNKNLYMCFVDIEKAFDRVPRKVMELAMRKKGLSEVIVWAVMSLYDGAKTRVRVGFAYSEAFEVKVGVHQGSLLLLLLLITRPLLRDGGMAEDHGAPEAGQLPRVWTRGHGETESRQRVSGAKSP